MKIKAPLKAVCSSLLVPLFLLTAGSALSAIVIPGIISDSGEIESLHETRLKKGIEFGDRNKDFVSKLNALQTLMQTFHKQNVRMKLGPSKLREAQDEFRKEYTQRYLALDSTAWWWYWDIEREAQIFSLLSPAELDALHKETFNYGNSVLASTDAIDPLWHYLSSRDYDLNPASLNEFKKLSGAMRADSIKASGDRGNHVYNLSQLFARSVHRRVRKTLFQRIFQP